MPNEPNWLPIEEVIAHNQRELAGTEENHFIETWGCSKVRGQGNKRTAFGAMRLFLRISGFDTSFDDTVPWGDEIIAVIEHRSTEQDFAGALRPYIVPRP